jgi:hemolysin III
MGKLDYTFIFCVVAFSYAPLYLLLIPNGIGHKVLFGLACTVLAGAYISFADHIELGRHSLVLVYIFQSILQLVPMFTGWISGDKSIFEQLESSEKFALLFMGACYLVGSQTYANRFPDPWPKAFGYHEIWHLLITVSVGCTYYVNYSVVVRL